MKMIIRFILWTLILTVGVFVTMSIPFVTPVASSSMARTLSWFIAPILIGSGVALVAKNCGRGALMLAIPIAVLLANGVVGEIWPPQVRHNIFRALNAVAKRDTAYRDLRKQLLPVTSQKLIVPPALQRGWDAGEHSLNVAHGVQITVFATGLIQPRNLTVDAAGVLFVSLPHVGQVVSLHDVDGDGQADKTIAFAVDLDQPSGLAFHHGELCVATAGQVVAFADKNNDYVADVKVGRIVSDDLPPAAHHWAHALIEGADKQLYVSVGAEVAEDSWQKAAVLRVADDGTLQMYASGLYDCQGLAVHPQSGSLWSSENAPQTIGYFVHPDEINVLRKNGDYGWPFCYGNRLPDAKLGSTEICNATYPSLVQLPAQSIPGGLVFGNKLNAAEYFKSMVYIALQGANLGKRQQGFRLLAMPLDSDGRISGWGVDLVSGWSVVDADGGGATPWGQPVDCVVGGDGCLYLSDNMAGCIYRISFL